MVLNLHINNLDGELDSIDDLEEVLAVLQELVPKTLRSIIYAIKNLKDQNLDNSRVIIQELENKGVPNDLIEDIAKNFSQQINQ